MSRLAMQCARLHVLIPPLLLRSHKKEESLIVSASPAPAEQPLGAHLASWHQSKGNKIQARQQHKSNKPRSKNMKK